MNIKIFFIFLAAVNSIRFLKTGWPARIRLNHQRQISKAATASSQLCVRHLSGVKIRRFCRILRFRAKNMRKTH